MSKVTPVRGLLATLVTSAVTVRADVFNMPAGQTSLQFVTVGNPGNAADTSGYGAVPYVYQMGKYDVTVAQYVQFLNDVAASDPYGLYNSNMATVLPTLGIARSGSPGNYSYVITGSYDQAANCPIFDVNWGDAARFCNWLDNAQGTATTATAAYALTENGAYTLNGDTSILTTETRNPGVSYFLPTENEWYKAAYYVGGGTNAGYWLYPTRSNAVPINVLSATGTNNANYGPTGPIDADWVTPVGAFAGSPGPYGTYDMGGDVYQWNEAVDGSYRGFRGGSFYNDASYMLSSYRAAYYPYAAYFNFGFRVAAEPSNVVAWTSAVSGSWSSAANWTGGIVPDGIGAGAVFSASTAVPLTITLSSPETVGSLQFGNSGSASAGYTLSGSGSNDLTLNNSGSGATITVTGGRHAIDVPVVLADNLVVTSGGSNSWTLQFGPSGIIMDNGGDHSLTMNGSGGTLVLSGSNSYGGGTNVEAGTLIVATNNALPDGTNLTVGAGATQLFGTSLAGTPAASAIAPVPEPGALSLLGVATIGSLACALRRRLGKNASHLKEFSRKA